MNRRNFLTSMVAALVAAPVVARAAANASAWGESAILVSKLSAESGLGSCLRMMAPTEVELRKMLSYTRVVDCRWVSLQHAINNGRYSESAFSSDDGSAHPLRFNEHRAFIEPMFMQPEGDGITWKMNPAWKSAKWQASVSPDTDNPMEYQMEILRHPDMNGSWIGQLVRANELPHRARPTATYFKRA